MITSLYRNISLPVATTCLFLVGAGLVSAAEPATPPAQGNGAPPSVQPGGPKETKGAKRPAAAQNRYPLSLPRLSEKHAAPLNPRKIVVDPLQVPAGATGTRKQSQSGVEYLEFDPAKSWSHVLRGNPKDIVFVSFCANASLGTEIEVGGARLRVVASKEKGKAQVQVRGRSASGKMQWRSVGVRAPIDTYNTRALSPLPVFTVRLDPNAGVWDIYLGTRQLVAGLPLAANTKPNEHKFHLLSGKEGAQLCALMVAKENPLFVDANANGIDDGFELTTKGALLAKTAEQTEVRAVAKAWRDSQKGKTGNVLGARRPAPDRVALVAKAK
jgi:hypothetical protein